MTENNLINTLKLCEDISKKSFDIEKNNIVSALDLVNTFKEKYKDEKSKIPYQLNLIDELRANENAHSRILVKLLNYKIDEKLPILESFIEYLNKNHSNFQFNEKLNVPEITPEKHRIDAFIKGKDYAIIIENKIHNAIDQEEQISKYIDEARKQHLKDENIFIIYLSRDGGSPDKKSFSEKDKDDFKNRYLEISYRYDIIPWLENHVLPNCRLKEEFLISAVQQYIDHLQGMFNLRKIEKDMNEKLIKELEEQLNLTNDYKEDIEIISEKIKNIDLVKDYLKRLLDRMQNKAFKDWEEKIRADFGSDNEYYKLGVDKQILDSDGDPKIGLIFEYKELRLCVYIGFYYKEGPYFAIVNNSASTYETKNEQMTNYLEGIIRDFKQGDKCNYGYTYTTFEEVYDKFKNKVNEVLKLINDDLKTK